jgi:hypothetical protein
MHLVSAHFSLHWFFCRPDPSIVGASDIGQGPTYLRYILEYLIVSLLADQPGNQQILLNEGSIKLPLKY